MTYAATILLRKAWLKRWTKSEIARLRKAGKTMDADHLAHLVKHVLPVGYMGEWARRLLREFQLHVGLSPTGRWNGRTVEALRKDYTRLTLQTPTQKLLYAAGVWYSKRALTHYSYPAHNLQRMTCPPLPGVARWTDCSGMIRCIWQQLNWPDPAGAGYGVWGNSDSFIQQTRNRGKFVSPGSEKAGDIVCYTGGVGHAELVVARGKVLTNGNEAGPYYRGLGQHAGRMYICRLYPFA